eukprot:4142293-Amphidinium_carterae.1
MCTEEKYGDRLHRYLVDGNGTSELEARSTPPVKEARKYHVVRSLSRISEDSGFGCGGRASARRLQIELESLALHPIMRCLAFCTVVTEIIEAPLASLGTFFSFARLFFTGAHSTVSKVLTTTLRICPQL